MKPPRKTNLKIGRRFNGRSRFFERVILSSRALNTLVTSSGKALLTCMIWPRFFAPFRWRITRHPLPLANLNPLFAGYKILQLTDLHVGRTRVDYLGEVFDRCMEEKPNLVVITGDLIDYRPSALPKLRKLLKRLTESKHKPGGGIVAIFGNHDYHEYSWRHVGERSAKRAVHKRLVKIVREAGITLLRNERYAVEACVPPAPGPGGQAQPGFRTGFTLVGLDEMWTGRADAAEAFKGVQPGEPVICLQHNPDGVEFLKPFPWQFMLCGHSHGGQAIFPMIGALYVPMEHRQYLRGFFQFPPHRPKRKKAWNIAPCSYRRGWDIQHPSVCAARRKRRSLRSNWLTAQFSEPPI